MRHATMDQTWVVWIERLIPRKLLELSLISVLAVLVYIQNYEPVESWLVSHWLFDYQLGFTKRALVGEIFRLLQPEISYRQIELIGFCLGLVLSLQVAFLAYVIYGRINNPLIPCLILFIPFSIPEIAREGARFDTINYIATISFLLLPRHLRSVWLAGALSVVMLLIHEGSLVIQLPLLWIAASYDGEKLDVRRVCILAGIAVVAVVVILTFSRLTIGADEFLSFLERKLPPTGNALTTEHYAGYYVLFISFFDNAREVLAMTFSARGVAGLFTVAVFIIGWLKLAQVLPTYLRLTAANTTLLPLMAGLSPLILVGLGMDWYRWCALMAINALIITAYLVMQENDAARAAANERPDRRRFTQTSNYLILLFAISLTPFPAWYPGEMRDGIQCLAADYNVLSPPIRTLCPSADFQQPTQRR